MPCAGGRVFLGPDNLHFRKRLRRAHPKTDDVMRRQRQMCLEARLLPAARVDSVSIGVKPSRRVEA